MRPSPALAAALSASVAFATLAPRPASAGEIQLSMAAGGEGSAWAGDGAGFVGLRAGYRFVDLIAPYFMARAGYGTINQRVLELIQIGAQIWARIGITRPYLRLGMVHQHEEPWAAYKVDLFNSFLGVGDGIAHRFGGEFALGVDVPVKQFKAWQFHLTFEGFSTVFPPDGKGPRAYGAGTAGFGFNYALDVDFLSARTLPALAIVLLAGCNIVTIDEYPCPSGGTTLTYQSFGQSFMAAYCNTCHSAPDGQREGAPADFVFDTQAEVIAHKDRIFARAADTNNSMPPGPDSVPAEQRVRLAEWLACGAP